VIRRYLRRTTFVPSKFLSRILRGRGGLLSFGVNLRVYDFCLFTLTLVVAQKCTLITSLSEFISVFKQPTSSVVFRLCNYMCSMILKTKQSCRLETLTLFKIKVSLILKS
jgi:hypothetical protein